MTAEPDIIDALAARRRAKCTVKVDEKGGVELPTVPAVDDFGGHCAWLTAVFNLDADHPVIVGRHEGLRGAAGHVVLERLDAPPIRFEPASRINTPQRLVEDLSWQTLPTDGAVHAFKGTHCRVIAHVVRMFCGVTKALTDEQETAAIVGAYLATAHAVENHTTYGTGPQRYEAAEALRSNDAPSRHSVDHPWQPRYLIDRETGELAIPVSALQTAARRYVGGSLARGWVDARMEGLGWKRVRLDGHAASGRAGRGGPHARIDVYRGDLPAEPDATDDHDAPSRVTT